ncbi:MAG: hypothetical protein H2170_06445 [Opitutus sp.]|nr:hypothetical protein [Opitutus sp.]
MNSAETKPKEWGLGKPCAGKPLARFDEGEGRADGLPTRGSLYSTECKASSSPSVTRGFWTSLDDLKITEAYVVAPIQQSFPIGKGIEAVGLAAAVKVVTG